MKRLIATFIMLLSLNTYADVNEARRVFVDYAGANKYEGVSQNLIKSNFYFAAIPFIKEYLSLSNVNRLSPRLNGLLESVISKVGIKQFEILPMAILNHASSPVIQYIQAKKMFRKGRYQHTLRILRDINTGNPISPFSLMVRASAHAMLKHNKSAREYYRKCVNYAEKYIVKEKDSIRKRQLKITRDYCEIGEARVLYQAKLFESSGEKYMDLPKSSPVWPEVLFEEAWVSYNKRNYNRSLGKLVTYKAPFFEYLYSPEYDVLRALSYLKLCLYEDVQKEVDNFYRKYDKESKLVENYIARHGRDYDFYFRQATEREKGPIPGPLLLNRFLKSITQEPAYLELVKTLEQARWELEKIKELPRDRFRSVLYNHVIDTLKTQKRLIGSFVRRELVGRYNQILTSFQDMSYLKLEVLSKRKVELYTISNRTDRVRGDIHYLKRNDRQYFWDFNGEFWVDELGDYVFALRSECHHYEK